ncbi:hypothetical protein J6590_030516 [Homalodisca vitripennis]|nr:hypothetical protein J6590_030516 [Homalodisca vitripennis]
MTPIRMHYENHLRAVFHYTFLHDSNTLTCPLIIIYPFQGGHAPQENECFLSNTQVCYKKFFSIEHFKSIYLGNNGI